MSDLEKAARLALDAMESALDESEANCHIACRAILTAQIDALRAALEQAEPMVEPVAWRTFDGEGGFDYHTYAYNENYASEWEQRNPNHKGWVEPLYLAPQQAEPVVTWSVLWDEDEPCVSIIKYLPDGNFEVVAYECKPAQQAEPVAMDKLIQIAWKMGFDAGKAEQVEQAEPVVVPGMDADAWLRQLYFGYKAHPDWRALAEAFNAGRSCRQQAEPVVDGSTSDGHHTFNELYDFRMSYNAALFNEWAASGKHYVHKSRRHHDGELCFGGGYFVVVAVLPGGQISNHYKDKYWDLFDIPQAEKALFEFDGHTGTDVLSRLRSYRPQRAKPVVVDTKAEGTE
jgi:hypothetical protein